ncbi:hypothetical protein ID866_11282 [Astraeus odoratus]|nr:hypothetical protein ID866_11282 [Astraeus odoratus]
MANLWKKMKEGCMKERTAERREQEVAEQKRKEEEEAWRAEEAEKEAKEAEKAAEAWRRAVDRQHKPSMIIPAGGSTHRSTSGPSSGTRAPCDRCSCRKAKASCSWSKAARGVAHKWRRTQTKEDDREDDEEDDEDNGEGDFVVLPALVALLKEFKGSCHDQWDLQAHQVRGLKALQKEMKKANALKVKELGISTKGKERAVELSEELSESGKEEEEVKDGNKGGVAEGEGNNGDGDVEMGAAPSASII